MLSIRDGDPRGGDGGDCHGELGYCGGAYSGGRTTPGSSCCCRGVRNPDLKSYTKTFTAHYM